MATLLLAAAGSAVGGAFGGTLFAGLSAAAIGQAAGGVLGGLIDQQIMGGGAKTVETGRVSSLRVQGAREGAPIARIYGRMRVAGNVIWSTRFLETVQTETQSAGGKGSAPSTTVESYSYSISLALSLSEGVVDRIGRIWADGKLFALEEVEHRLHRGLEDQPADPLISAVEGAAQAPAYRGLAYLVIENLQLERFGNRIPQFNVEIFRAPTPPEEGIDPEEFAPPLRQLVKAVALSPGSGEASMETDIVMETIGAGATAFPNANGASRRPDIIVALDQLAEDAPACEAISMVVSWFGDDLRAGHCRIEPAIEASERDSTLDWSVSGVERAEAKLVGLDDEGRPIYGGTPPDGSIIRSIREMAGRGLKVMFYPFILMDVPADNGKPDPWTGAPDQPPFPWRGRITTVAAPGQPGSTDGTAAAADEVASFFGAAAPGDFAVSGDDVRYVGPEEWSLRRMVLHYAHLCAVAGGVESFCIGSELRGITQIRSAGVGVYPAVAELKRLAADCRAILGPGVKIGYAADWSEYFGHRPDDGSGDVFFHLDPLWADPAIDFVGIDNYMPLADWRYEAGHADAAEGATSVYSLAYLRGNVEGGEGFDWFYASSADRMAQARQPISDGAHGEDWVFRYKDLRNWWSQPHHNRPGGVRSAAPTGWVPRSKPFWFTEIGCPAVDLGANQPNVFFDPKSSESALPYFSAGVRDDHMQRRFLQAGLSYWDEPGVNPVSPLYGGAMVETGRSFVWTWDARPWPDFPARASVWSDSPNHQLGHWLTGRLGSAPLADVVAEICAEAGVPAYDVSGLHGTVDGYMQERVQTGRSAIQSLMLAYGFDAVESGGVLRFTMRGGPAVADLELETLALTEGADEDEESLSVTRASEGDLPRSVRAAYVMGDGDYEPAATEATAIGALATRVEETEMPLAARASFAQGMTDRWLAEAWAGRESATFTGPPSLSHLEAGDVVTLPVGGRRASFRIDRIEDAETRRFEARRIEDSIYRAVPAPERVVEPTALVQHAPVLFEIMDLPLRSGLEDPHAPVAAAFATPWPGGAAVFRSATEDGFARAAVIRSPAAIGATLTDLPAGAPWLWQRASVSVRLTRGAQSRAAEDVLNGANVAALAAPQGGWEIIQFQEAELVKPNEYLLRGFLRGQAGTEGLIGAPTPAGARIVLLDGAETPVPTPPSLRGLQRNYRVGPIGAGIDHPAFRQTPLTFRSVALRPYAPAHFRGRRDASGGLVLNWIRRARVDGDAWEGFDAPLGESSELYQLDIRDEDGRGRTWIVDEPGAVYALSAQAEDGVVGPLVARVAQVSQEFGLGPYTEIDL